MRRRARAGYGPAPRCEGFAVRLEPLPEPQRRALQLRAGTLLYPSGASWRALDESRRSSGWLVIARSGQGRSHLVAPRTAWQRAQAIAGLRGVRSVEPLFRGPGLEPEPRYYPRLLATHERSASLRAAKGFGEGAPLPCARDDALWSVRDVRAIQAWMQTPPRGGRQLGAGICIAHPDTGFREHPEIWDADAAQRRVLASQGRDFEDHDRDAHDPPDGSSHGHGTATASVILSASEAPGQRGVAGIAPRAQLVPLRVSDGVVHFSFRNAIEALHYAIDHTPAHIVSMSLGGPWYSRALAEVVERAIARGIIVIAAAGNVWPFVTYPARLPGVIAVAASNCRSLPWAATARGRGIALAAPGESVWRALARYRRGALQLSIAPGSGTSYATAAVAGACALWLAFHDRNTLLRRYGAPRLAEAFRSVLLDGGVRTPRGWNRRRHGAGILDVDALLRAPLPDATALDRAAAVAAKVPTPLQQLADYFPDLPAPAMRSVLRRNLTRPLSPLLEQELAFHVGSSARLRSRLHAAAATSRASKGAVSNPFTPIARQASPALRAVLLH